MPSLFRLPKPVAVSGSQTYAGSKLYFYVTGTTTPTDVYTDADLSITHANPVEADADGVFEPIWLDPEVTYKVTWRDSGGSLIYTVDPASDSLSAATIGRSLYPRTAAEISAGVTPTDYSYEPGNVRRYGAVGDGVTDDRQSINSAVNSGQPLIRIPAGTYLLSTDTAISVPSGVTIEGDGPNTIIKKSSGTADIFTTTGSNVTFRNFRMEGPNNTSVDGISTDGGSDILIENIEGYQLSSTVTIGLTTATSRATVRNIFSDDNAQQGVHFNKATSPRFSNLRADGIGTSNLHHGVYIGNCTDVIGDTIESTNGAGSGVHIFAQSSFTFDRCEITNINCRGNGTSASGNRAGVLVARDSSSTMRGIVLTNVTCYDNNGFNILVENVDECQINLPYCDGNNEGTSNGIYLNTTFAITTNYKVLGGHSKAHGSNIRIPVSSGATTNVEIDQILVADADTGGNAGIFASGAGTCNLYLGDRIRFSNNATNITSTVSGGGGTFLWGTTIPASSYTGTLTGIAGTDPTGTVQYSVNGDVVTLYIPSISGTSDTTAATLTGMPTVIRPKTAQTVFGLVTDNGTAAVSQMTIGTNGTITLYHGTSATFTSSGTKAVGPCTVSYRLT
jgi:hypothetical protein